MEHWHYSRRMPKSKLAKIGVWEDGGFIGAVVFGVGATPDLMTAYGLTAQQGCELLRIALREHRAPVSRIVSVAVGIVRRTYPGLRLIVSFADPREGHHGGIYQASNWLYLGTTASDRVYRLEGREVHPRAVSLMIKSGRLKGREGLNRIKTPGKYRYAVPLDDEMRRKLAPLARPYPKRATRVDSGSPGDQPGGGGADPTVALVVP